MWTGSDRRMGEVVRAIEREREQEKNEKRREQAKEAFDQTLKKLWPLKSNEKPS